MKKILLFMAALMVAVCANAQFMRAEELEKYAKERFGSKWSDAATNIAQNITLDKNNSLTYIQVVNCPGQTKDQLYQKMHYWFSASFNDANHVIQMDDKDAGTIIGVGLVSNIASHVGGINRYDVSIRPIIKVDIKDNKIRITYTVQNYDVLKSAGGGALNNIGQSFSAIGGQPSNNKIEDFNEKWPLEQCFPFVKKDKHKKTSSKALVMTHAYSNVIMDKIEEAAKNGIVGNENDEW